MDAESEIYQAPDLLRSALLDGIIYLFAAISAADDDLASSEAEFVGNYLGSHIDGPRRDILMGLFRDRVDAADPSSTAVDFILKTSTAADRAFLLLKGAELVHQSHNPGAGRKRFADIAARIGFDESEIEWAMQFANDAFTCAPSGSFRSLLIRPASEDSTGDAEPARKESSNSSQLEPLFLPGCQAEIDIVFTEGTTLVRCRTSTERVIIGSRVPAVDSLVRLDESEPLHLDQLCLSARDLRFYAARQALAEPVAQARCFIAHHEGDFALSAKPPPSSCLELQLEGTRLSITPLKIESDSDVHRRGTAQAVTVATTFRYAGRILALRPILQALWPHDWSANGDGKIPGAGRLPAMDGHIGLPIASLRLDEVTVTYPGGHTGLDQVSFETQFGHLVCLLGPSGCGKSTLLNVLNGSLPPSSGTVSLNGKEFGQRSSEAARHISYVPQDDLLDPNLTVWENLRFGAELRMPGASSSEVDAAVTRVLHEIGLSDWRNTRVGSLNARTLSGGQRKRVNIGLELLGNRRVLLLDEPTSGLSAADAWQVAELLRRRADQGDLVVVVAHQPSARLLDLFTDVVVLDRGGRMAFFGSTSDAYAYFSPYAPQMSFSSADRPGNEDSAPHDPELIFTALERRSRHIDGSRSNQRRFPPRFWQAHYLANRSRWRPPLLRVERGGKSAATGAGSGARAAESCRKSGPPAEQQKKSKPVAGLRPPSRSRHVLEDFGTLMRREFLSRRRAVSNLAVMLFSAILLGGAIAWACRLDPSGHDYHFSENPALQHFMFLSIVTVLFLAMSASVSEIVRDRPLRQRERLLQVPTSLYLSAKFLPLLCLVVVQSGLFLAIAYLVLEIPEIFASWWLFLSVTACCGLAIGLLVSSLPGITSKAASAAIPLLLIPQIILAGAEPFPFKNMAHLRLATSTQATTNSASAGEPDLPHGYSAPPEIAQLIPSRWAYEGLVCLYRDGAVGGRVAAVREYTQERVTAMFPDADPPLVWKDGDLPRRLVIPLRVLLTPSIATSAAVGRDAVSKDKRFLEISAGRPCSPELVELYVLQKSIESGADGWQTLPEWMQNYSYSPQLVAQWGETEARAVGGVLPREFQQLSENNHPALVRQPLSGALVSPIHRATVVLLAFTAVLLTLAWFCLRFETALSNALRRLKRCARRSFSKKSASASA